MLIKHLKKILYIILRGLEPLKIMLAKEDPETIFEYETNNIIDATSGSPEKFYSWMILIPGAFIRALPYLLDFDTYLE